MNCRLSLLCALILATLLPHRAQAGRSIVVNNSYRTPLGSMEIASRIGDAAPLGAVFKHRVPTGEVLKPNAAGRDPIVTRILWLRGKEAQNARAYDRGIYIHGTPVERLIGRPASYGCIRMRSADIVKLYDAVDVGTPIDIVTEGTARAAERIAQASRTQVELSSTPVAAAVSKIVTQDRRPSPKR
jgi:hypothetical protein